MPTGLLVRFQETEAALDKVVWHLGLATYMEHSELSRQLEELLEVPHLVLYALGSHYAAKLDISKRDHGTAISVVGEVFKLAGAMAAAYEPSTESDDDPGANEQRHGMRLN